MHQLDFTLSAGPVMATPRTLAAMGQPIVYHYDPEFLERFRRVEAKAAKVFQTTNDVFVMQGEAILALESAARSLVTEGMHVLNLVQGVFGKGMGYWLTDFGAVLHEIEVSYNDAVSPAAVEEYLAAHPEIEMIAMVHSETPSGTITDCEAIGKIAHKHGALTLVDAVSSIGGLEFKTDAWNMDVVVTGAQKCLGGPAGIGLVAINNRAWTHILTNPRAPRDSYLSLIDWKTKWREEGRFPFTPSVSDIYGVESVLDQVLEEGLENSYRRHANSAAVTRAGVVAMGLELWPVSTDISANCLTTIRLPESLGDVEVRTYVRERYGVMLSSGQGAGNLVRIAHMGPSASGMYPIVGLASLGRALVDKGISGIAVGAGIEAAMAVLAENGGK